MQFVQFLWQQQQKSEKRMDRAVAVMTSEWRAWGVCGSAWVSLGNDRPHQFFQGTVWSGDLPVYIPVITQDSRPQGARAASRPEEPWTFFIFIRLMCFNWATWCWDLKLTNVTLCFPFPALSSLWGLEVLVQALWIRFILHIWERNLN